jgi:hypothetical protein
MYTQLSASEQRQTVNPFCRAFPTDVSCTVPNVGAAGGEQGSMLQNSVSAENFPIKFSS